MNSESIEQFIIVKYYNRKINRKENNNLIESWNIMNKVKNKNRDFNEYKDFFKISLKRILYDIRYLKIWEV